MRELNTTRLHMRPFTLGDGDDLARLHGDAELMAYMRGGVQTRAEAIAELAWYNDCWAAHGVGMWALFAEGAFIGECGLRLPYNNAQGIRLRFIIYRPNWGRGYAGEAVAAPLSCAF